MNTSVRELFVKKIKQTADPGFVCNVCTGPLCALQACQGVVLLVDANRGVQAQTVANFYLAFTSELAIVSVVNKIDLKNADPERVIAQMARLFDCDPDRVCRVSTDL